jgi:arylamine N-acetyltransferase
MTAKTPQSPQITLPTSLQYLDTVDHFLEHFKIFREPDKLAYLRAILRAFAGIPYENLSKISKFSHQYNGIDQVRLPDEVLKDHITHKLGGTCFSLTYLLQSILENEKYVCYPVLADMNWGRNVHCALIVLLDGAKVLVDPGYCLSEPLSLSKEAPGVAETDVTTVRCEYDNKTGTYHLFTITQNLSKWRYNFRDEPVGPERFLEQWLASFHWNGMHGFCLTRVENGRMIYIHKEFMRETRRDGKTNYKLKGQVVETVRSLFSIPPEIIREAREALESNLERERRSGLWTPRQSGKKTS